MRPYPLELRQHVVAQLARGWTPAQVATTVGISVRTVTRYRTRARQGRLAPRPPPGRARRIPEPLARALGQYLQVHPHATITELHAWLVTTHGIETSPTTVWRTVHQLGYRRARRPQPE